jgi:cellulose synthase/poly-beta-1,6-N-acetylglucosamine synthase-like glycosyltransferase
MYLAALLLISILLLAYCMLIMQYRKWFSRLQIFTPKKNSNPIISFSVIIPARNEAAGIGTCLKSILQQSYPKALFDVIVVNDHSTDATVEIVQALQQTHDNLYLINLAEHVKLIGLLPQMLIVKSLKDGWNCMMHTYKQMMQYSWRVR